MTKNIELELRAPVNKKDFIELFNKLTAQGKLVSQTDRLSVMFFGDVRKEPFDIRVRITNNQSEIVIKKGSLHSSNRTEYSQKIPNHQFVDMVKLISQFGFKSKVGQRKIFNFKFPDHITVSLVQAGELAYLEIEKMTNKTNQTKDKKNLKKLAKDLKVNIVDSKKEFDDFCKKLNETVDWEFFNTKECYQKLSKAIAPSE